MSEVFPRNILLRAGGRTLPRHGVLAVAGPRRGLVDMPITFPRADASTCATYIDRDGILRLAAANVLRTEWVDLDGDGVRETPGLLLEGSRIQLVTDHENFNNWTVQGVVARTSGQVDPFGGTGAYLLDSNTPSNADAIY